MTEIASYSLTYLRQLPLVHLGLISYSKKLNNCMILDTIIYYIRQRPQQDVFGCCCISNVATGAVYQNI